MFLRFVVRQLDPDSHRRQGLFMAAWDLRNGGKFTKWDEAWHDQLREWFNEHLQRPDRLARSSKPHAHSEAVGWFRHTAVEHIARMREFAALLEQHGLTVDVLRTERPGAIVYEDEFQVAAVPFRDGEG